jgi:hypothetical protein
MWLTQWTSWPERNKYDKRKDSCFICVSGTCHFTARMFWSRSELYLKLSIIDYFHSHTGVVFESQPDDIESTCQANEKAIFHCTFIGSTALPQWMINGTHYKLNTFLPPDHSYSNNMLTVTNLRSNNDSLYQCVRTSTERCLYKSREARLICKGITLIKRP